MLKRLLPLLLIVALVGSLAGCGSDGDSSTGSSKGSQSTSELLNGWSDTTLAALVALQARGKAATARDKAAFDRADERLQKELKKIVVFPSQAQSSLGSESGSATGKAVIADAAAWNAWAALLQKKSLSDQESLEAGRLGGAAAQAHLAAYKAAGVEVPADFQKQTAGS